jgi:hypothetical protein
MRLGCYTIAVPERAFELPGARPDLHLSDAPHIKPHRCVRSQGPAGTGVDTLGGSRSLEPPGRGPRLGPL